MCLMKETKKINAVLDVKLNKSSILYHAIWVFANMKQYESCPNGAFKLHFENFYETMELASG